MSWPMATVFSRGGIQHAVGRIVRLPWKTSRYAINSKSLSVILACATRYRTGPCAF
jgi:hypothetical protein